MKAIVAFSFASITLAFAIPAHAHLVNSFHGKTLKQRIAHQERNLAHARYVASEGSGKPAAWHREAVRWIGRELKEARAALRRQSVGFWAQRQIWLAEKIGPLHADAWPNCPDPFDSRSYTWQDTVACENHGNWLDSPGFYRCGLQFHPGWERKYRVRVCP